MSDKDGYLDEEDFETEFGKNVFRDYFGIFFRNNGGVKREECISPLDESDEISQETITHDKHLVDTTESGVEAKVSNFCGKFEENSDKLQTIPVLTKESEFSLYSITEYSKDNHVVGEEANEILITLALANKIHIILEGDSGTGKSHLIENILRLFDGVYEFGLSSGQAMWYQADEINSAKVIYIPELQKVVADRKNKVSSVIEFLKSLGEGKDAKKDMTNKSRDGVDSYKISANGKVFATTIANENSFKYDRELQRRFLIVETDSSKEHIDDIINNKVSRRMVIDVRKDEKSLEYSLSERIKNVWSMQDTYVLNPFLGYLQHFFPRINKTQAYLDHYLNLFDGIGKFFYNERKRVEVEGKKFVFLNLEDVYNVYSIYHRHFIRTLRSFSEDENVSQFIPDWTECFRCGIDAIRDRKIGIKFNKGDVLYIQDYPGLVDEWVSSQLSGGKIYTIDYKNGDRIEIADFEKTKLLPAPLIHNPFLVDS